MNTTNFRPDERAICERIEQIYAQQLDQELSRITCRISDRVLVLILEGAITPPEHLLTDNNQIRLAGRVRAVLDRILRPQIKDLIEQTMNVTVTDFLSDTAMETGRTGAIVIFECQPRSTS